VNLVTVDIIRSDHVNRQGETGLKKVKIDCIYIVKVFSPDCKLQEIMDGTDPRQVVISRIGPWLTELKDLVEECN
jgi:hypothetical protein